MRRLIMWNVITLDGYFEGREPWSLDWHEEVWGDELEQFSLEQLHGAGMLLFGRVTYEGMAAYWQTAEGEAEARGEIARMMNELPKMVFSRTLDRAEWAPSTLVREVDPAAVQRLKEEGEGELLVFGSGSLSAALSQADLFDEYRLMLAPIVLGSGTTLFGRGLPSRKLELLETRPLSSGAVLLRYRPGAKE
jgi:dihydrofolate reductase